MIRLKAISFIFLFFCASSLFGQNITKEIVIPPSPDAGHLGAYGEFSVSKTSGSVDVTVPILTIQEGGITVPVSLAYQSSGLRVEEKPSWVGMGWILNAGGVITRTMRGRCDDLSKGFLSNANSIPDYSVVTGDLGNTTFRTDVYEFLGGVVDNQIDYVPDAFSFNFQGHGGSFTFGNDRLVHLTDHSTIKIEPIWDIEASLANYPIIVGWQITDEQGLIYLFKAIETTEVNHAGTAMPEYISSWYLTSIDNPVTQTRVTFTYNPTLFNYEYSESSKSFDYSRSSGEMTFTNDGTTIRTQYVDHNRVKFLSGISVNSHAVTFTTSVTSEPYRRLTGITWANGSTTKTYTLNYDYFPTSSTCTAPTCKRSRLNSVTEVNGTNPKTYAFEYVAGNLPDKKSTGQDDWGYYNGKDGNNSLVPNEVYMGNTVGNGADRSLSLQHASYGMLSKIIYPTKGHSTFTYEQNTWEGEATLEDVTIVTKFPEVRVTGADNLVTTCKSQNVILREGGDGAIQPWKRYSIRYTGRIAVSSGYWDTKRKGTIKIYNNANGNLIRDHMIMHTDIDETIPYTELVPGNSYRFEICSTDEIITTYVNITLTEWSPGDIDQPIARPVGGLRIQRIDNYDPEAEQTITRTFDYGFGGYLLSGTSAIRYFSGSSMMMEVPPTPYEKYMVSVHSHPTSGLSASSTHVGYEKVVEYLGTKAQNSGWIESKYKKATDRMNVLPVSNHTVRSKLIVETMFNNTGTWVRKDSLAYTTQYMDVVQGFKVSRGMYYSGGDQQYTMPRDYLNDYRYNNFNLYSTWHKVISKTTKFRYPNGDVAQSTTYEYNNPLHQNATREITTGSDNEQLIKEMAYPLDKTACANSCYSTMTSELAACQLLPDRHTLESPTCAAIWDAKQSEYQTCLKNQAGTYNGGIYTGPRATCDANFKAALTAAGYYTCVGSSYPGCRKSAFVKYKACQDSYDVCIYNEYSTLTDPALKAVALMNVANMTAQPVSLKTKMGSTELSSTSVQYKIFNSVPLQEIVSESLNGGTARQMLTITKYDAKANPTEVTDHKANMNKSYIWGYDNKLLIAEFQNALLADVAHTSFENTSNEGSLTFTLTPDLSAKTGTKGHKLVGKPVRRIGLTASKKYIVSYWAKAGTPVLTTVPANASRVDSDGIQESSGWKYYEKLITGATEIEINTTDAAVIDEVRIAPENVVITTFTHQLGVGLSSKMDANGQVTSFDYESTGKLETVKDHDGNILRHLIYQYKQ